MVFINSIEIDGLYAYEYKQTATFSPKNVIVGTNDSGKSSIFKSIDFFIRSMAEYGTKDQPWKSRQTNSMTMSLNLDDLEKRFLIELLSVIPYDENRNHYRLNMYDVNNHLFDKFNEIIIKIVWHNSPYQPSSENMEYFLKIPELGFVISSRGFSGTTWITKDIDENFDFSRAQLTFGEIMDSLSGHFSVEGLLQQIPNIETKNAILVFAFPSSNKFSVNPKKRHVIDSETQMRIDLVFERAGITDSLNQEYSFFKMFGSFLQKKLLFVSESRNFIDPNSLEHDDLKNDGSNLQSFLFWLKNGNEDEKSKFEKIKAIFQKIHATNELKFDVNIVPQNETIDEMTSETIKLPKSTTVRFYDTSLNSSDSYDFNSVGQGIRESLFLLAKCIGTSNSVIMLDEPATNIHPILIENIMTEIMNFKDEIGDENQIIIITHSPVLASLNLLNSTKNIIRVSKESRISSIVQPTTKDLQWIENNLPTFHLLKTDVLFSKTVVLVEGPSDKIFLDTIIKFANDFQLTPNEIFVLDVGGSGSFPKFREFLDIFEVSYLILADNDVQNRFEAGEYVHVDDLQLDKEPNDSSPKTYVLTKDLEGYFESIEPTIYSKFSKYKHKPERAYHFVNELINNGNPSNLEPIRYMIKHLYNLINPPMDF